MNDSDHIHYEVTELGKKIVKSIIDSYNEYYGNDQNLPKVAEVPDILLSMLMTLGFRENFESTLVLLYNKSMSMSALMDFFKIDKDAVNKKFKELELSGIVQAYLKKT